MDGQSKYVTTALTFSLFLIDGRLGRTVIY